MRAKNPIEKRELCTLMQRRITTINRMMEPLEQSGIVVEYGIGESTGGRKPLLYGINKNNFYVGAVNISSTYCEVAIMNFLLEVLAVKKFFIDSSVHPKETIEKISNTFHEQLRSLSISKDNVCGVGVSVFASLNRETGKLYRPRAFHLNEAWVQYPLMHNLKEEICENVVIDKSVNASAMFEYLHGKGKNSKRMIYIRSAMSTRCTVIMDGQIISNAPRSEDAFGHMTVNLNGDKCVCGNTGCVECYASIPAIEKVYNEQYLEKVNSKISTEAVTKKFRDICKAAESGDVSAMNVVSDAASVLGVALGDYINLICPDTVVLSGLLVKESELYYNAAVESAKRRIGAFHTNSIEFQRSNINEDTITLGSGVMIIESLLSKGI